MTIRFGLAVATALALSGTPAAWAARPPPADLTGTWTNAWYTPLERPKEFKGLVATPEEAEAFEAPRRALHGMLVGKEDKFGQAATEFNDRGPGLARIGGQIRSSWIVDPADGKLPFKPGMRAQVGIGEQPLKHFDNVEDRPTMERCLTATGAGAPILNSADSNLVQIVQTRDAVVILSEKNHDARIVHLKPPAGPALPSWTGTSIGHWEGRTLVVVTTGFRPGVTNSQQNLYLSDQARVTERFTRTGLREIAYRFEVDDPGLYIRPWKGEMVFRASEAPIYEFACHEGNYSLPSILAGARQEEEESKAGK
jgi:hypothetical protein